MAPVAELLADRYELGARLGSGGMGDVYRARDRLLERDVAVKVPTTTVTPASAERFKREARAAARLNHPNVVGVYDWGGGTEPFIVMEFVEGHSLRAELRTRHTLPPAEVAAIGAEIADALAHAHHHGVVHRDVKPSNVLLTPGGSVKVTDFGIAESTAGEALTEPGVVLGTVGYLSPEQIAGLPADARSDVYSLGIVLTELLTGERPVGGEPHPATELERVIARARAADPNARYQAAAELRDDLRVATAGDAPAPVATPAAGPRTASPLTAVSVTVDTAMSAEPVMSAEPKSASSAGSVDPNATARATGAAATAVLHPAPAAVVTPPPRTGDAVVVPKGRRFRRSKATYPKVAKAPKPVKPLKPPKPKRRARRAAAAVAVAPATVAPVRSRTWKLRHWAVILAAPVLLVAGGVTAYAVLNAHGPMVAVPDVVDRDLFPAIAIMRDAGFTVKAKEVTSPRPGGVILSQRPATGKKLEEGSAVTIEVSSPDAQVPDVRTMDIEDAKVALGKRGLLAIKTTPDYRDDVDPGTVTGTNPAAYLKARKANELEVIVAADPHVTVPNVVGLDQATATSRLQAMGLDVAVQTASSKTQGVGQVLKSSPGGEDTAVRGDTVTLTVSSGPKQVAVPYVVGSDKGDAIEELEDGGFSVSVVTVTATSSDQVDAVVTQTPSGGQAPEGSTITISVGVKAKK